ncbi:MAG TPA: hypothetical protein VMQ73_22830 [Methylomirabilota bacterium]|nr:hypothetical protein [Methylomirabilota bacterium]
MAGGRATVCRSRLGVGTMDESYDVRIMQGVVMYVLLLALLLFGGAAFWFGYRVFGAVLMAGAAALLAWVAAGRML